MAIPTHILSALVDALAELYPEPADARTMSRFAGLEEQQIDFSGKAGNTWLNVVREAALQDRTAVLLARAQAQYPPLRTAHCGQPGICRLGCSRLSRPATSPTAGDGWQRRSALRARPAFSLLQPPRP